MKLEHPPSDSPTLEELAEAHNYARAEHRAAYIEWHQTGKLVDAIVRDHHRRNLRVFGYTTEQITTIEAELDARFSGS